MKNLNGKRVKNAGSNIINNTQTPIIQKQKVQNINNKKSQYHQWKITEIT